MTDQIALWIGYGFIYGGAPILAIFVLAGLAWAAFEIVWRRVGDLKLLHEFLRWRSGRIPGG